MALPKLSDIKNWSPEIEKTITSEWKSKPNTFNSKTKKPIYSIDTPPPYVNSPIHMGHAITYSYMDMFARYKRMQGHEVLFPLGLDRNGLPIETAAEKKFNISPFHVSREEFLKACEKLLESASGESTDSFARLGISFNSYKQGKAIGDIYHTDSPEYRQLTQSTFISLFKKELIYEDTRITNWDPKLQTTIADSEIDYKEIASTFNHITFKVKETGEEIVIATTRPELIASCGMIIYNPEDERYQKLEGLTAITPLYEKQVSIQEHPFAQQDKGTGLVMMCSAGDVTDIQFFREMNLKPVISINKDGTMNKNAGFLEGLKVKLARETIINELKEHKLLVKQEHITHRTPVSERSGAEIEFIEMPEFYLKQLEFKKDLQKVINKLTFYPEESKKILQAWLDSISIDWPISRRRFYATPIPLWHSGEYTAIPSGNKYYQPWREPAPKDAEVFKDNKLIGKITDKQFLKMEWKGETRVFDTWFDSSLSELFITKYQSDNTFFKKAYPISLRPQGKEIVRTWLYYTLLRGYLETSNPCFEDVWIHQHVLDDKGRKMSKSLGNVIDPQEIINNEGAEALRLWSVIEGDISKGDLSCSRERIKAEQKTITKLLNVAKFVMQFEKPKKAQATKTDEVLLSAIDFITKKTKESYDSYDFHNPALNLRRFLWEDFASHYIELVKARAYNEQSLFTKAESDAAKHSLYTLLERVIILMHPIIPQVTSIIAQALDLELNEFPQIKIKDFKEPKEWSELIAFNSNTWKTKRDKNISLREPISGIQVPKNLKQFEKDLKACHNLQ
jgi:valyl-tRNA synthetase